MKAKIIDLNKTEKGTKELPVQFNEQIRDDLIQRAVLALQSEARQPYGTKPRAGLRYVTEISRRRRDYKASYGHGISRVPRKILSRNGTQINWVGAKMPGTVGGRVAHPPKANRIWSQKINIVEKRKAVRSAMAATMMPAMVTLRGHRIPKEFPFLLDTKIESLSKTSDVEKTLAKLGFAEELKRTAKRKIRAGKGKNRGRKYQNKVGPLFVVSKECPLIKAAKNIPGIDVAIVQNINAELLAPGCHPGRLTLWSEAAVDTLATQKLFTEDYQGQTQLKEKMKSVATVELKKPSVKKENKKPTVKKETKKSA